MFIRAGVSWNGGGTPKEDTEGSMWPKHISVSAPREKKQCPSQEPAGHTSCPSLTTPRRLACSGIYHALLKA